MGYDTPEQAAIKQHDRGKEYHRQATNDAREAREWQALDEMQNSPRGRRILAKYALSMAEYNTILGSQGGACAICGEIVPLVVDHDHESEKVRGLLCSLCNSVLGFSKDDCERLLNAAAYLARSLDSSES